MSLGQSVQDLLISLHEGVQQGHELVGLVEQHLGRLAYSALEMADYKCSLH